MLWLIFLGIATCLTIVLRRVLRRQNPLNDALYSKTVAVEYVHSGVGWLREDGTFGSVNPSFAEVFGVKPDDLAGHPWYESFHKKDQARVREAYGQALLHGVTNLDAQAAGAGGVSLRLKVRLVAVNDGKMRVAGLYCLIEDQTRERALEARVLELEERAGKVAASPVAINAAGVVRRAIQRMGSPVEVA